MSASSISTIEVIPSARRLARSLRDLGYDFPQAVADLVDNSITAEATRVEVDLRFDGSDSWVRISDNGTGMNAAEITEAMRYGAEQEYEDEDLGKFGLGLKTASLSQCRILTVTSRRSATGRLEARQLDLNHVAESNRWEIFALGTRQIDEVSRKPLETERGTVVLWRSLDRILGHKLPWGRRAERSFEIMEEDLKLHLSMVFHRFLAGEVGGRRKVRIRVNGERIDPWDPFARLEADTQMLPARDIDLDTPDSVGIVRFQPYVLPARKRFSSEEAFQHHSGPRKWNAQQGLYIYRANRLVQSGGWCRMRAQDEHLKLARASVDFFPDLDPLFEVNVAKVRVTLPAELRDALRAPVEQLARAAHTAYRAHPEREASAVTRQAIKGARSALEEAAKNTGEMKALRRIAAQLRKLDPAVASRLGF